MPDFSIIDIPFAPDADPERDAFLARRRMGIGGSDAGAILGVSPYKSAFQVWAEKTQETPDVPPMNERMHWGIVLEQAVVAEFCRRTGKVVRRVRQQLAHKDRPWQIANLDRRIVGEDALLEVKTAGAWCEPAWDREGIPLYYRAQVAHYLAVTGWSTAYIAVLFGGQEFALYQMERDEPTVDLLVQRETAFWNDCVLTKTPPPIDHTAKDWLGARYPTANGQELSWDGDATKESICQRLAEAKANKKSWEIIEDGCIAQLQAAMGEAALATCGRFKVKWSQTSPRETIDAKKLKNDYPAAYKACAKTGATGRRFTLTTEKDED